MTTELQQWADDGGVVLDELPEVLTVPIGPFTAQDAANEVFARLEADWFVGAAQ